MTRTFFLLFVCGLLFFSCKSSRSVSGGPAPRPKSPRFLTKKLIQNQFKATWLSAKAKVVYRDDYGGVQKFTANLRLRKDSVIWMNFKKMSVEAVRLQITPDSFFLINRIDHEYLSESFVKAQKIFGLPAAFSGLQAMLLGNPVFFTKDLTASVEGHAYKLEGKTDRLVVRYWLEPRKYYLKRMFVEDFRNKRAMELALDDFEALPDGQNFSYFRLLNFNSPEYGDVSVKIELSKLEFNVPKRIRFEIPEHYKNISK